MAARATAGKSPKARKAPSNGAKSVQKTADTKNRKQRISDLLSKIAGRLEKAEAKATLADFIRLTQLERELEQEEQPKEIIVTWKDPAETRDTGR